VGQYVFLFVTFHANKASLFATVVANSTSRNHWNIVNFSSSIPAPKSMHLRPFDNVESGGTLPNNQNYFMVGGHVNDPAITTMGVALNFTYGSGKSVVKIPVSKEGLYFLFSKDAKGTSSVTGYDKAGNVVYKVGR
jgi:hypothetical protein